MHHSFCLSYILISLQAVLHGINPLLPRPTHWAPTSTLPYVDPRSNRVILHFLHMAEPSEKTFINLFVHILCHSTQLPYPCIREFIRCPDTQQTSELVHLYSSNPRPLLLTTIHKNRHQHRTLPHSSCRFLALTKDLIATATLLPLPTFLLHSSSFVPDSSKTHPKYLNHETCSKRIPSTQTSHSDPS